MSPLAKLRAELSNLTNRIQTGKLRHNEEVQMAVRYIMLANALVGAELTKELEQSKQPAKEVRP